MPFEIQNLNSRYYRGTEQIEYNQITVDLDDKDNIDYLPSTVHKIYTTNQTDLSDFSSDINVGQFAILIDQDIRSENGLYKQISADGVSRQSDPTKDTFFLDVSSEFKRAIFLAENSNYSIVNFNKVSYGTSINTTSGTSLTSNRIFNYPVAYSRPAVINTNIVGYSTSDDVLFDGEYKVMFYNKAGTSILKLDNFSSTTKRSNNSLFTLPTISFGVSMGTSGGNIDLVSNNNKTVDWYIKSECLF